MKFFKLLAILSLLVICICCKQPVSKQQINLESQSLSELVTLGKNSVNSKIFPEICRLLNDSILAKQESFYMNTIFIHEIIDMDIKDTIIDFKLKFYPMDKIPFTDVTTLYIILDNDSLFINNSSYKLKEIKPFVKDFIFNPSSSFGHYAIDRYYTRHWGEIEVSRVTATLVANIRKNNGLSIDEWRMYFNCLKELISVFEEKQNEIALTEWGLNFNSLSDEQKLDLQEIASYRIWLYFDLSESPLIREVYLH